MVLTIVVVTVQTLVFTLLTAIYIGLATEHEAHWTATTRFAGISRWKLH